MQTYEFAGRCRSAGLAGNAIRTTIIHDQVFKCWLGKATGQKLAEKTVRQFCVQSGAVEDRYRSQVWFKRHLGIQLSVYVNEILAFNN